MLATSYTPMDQSLSGGYRGASQSVGRTLVRSNVSMRTGQEDRRLKAKKDDSMKTSATDDFFFYLASLD